MERLRVPSLGSVLSPTRPTETPQLLPPPDPRAVVDSAIATPSRPLAEPGKGAFRADIEGLRALAVLLVLAYHAQLGPFSGGYIGVDVFFVLSGFLITTLLVRELADTGRISLPTFWARRARRLLPASCLVIVATLVAGHAVLAPLAQLDLAREGLAAATFVVNIVFANQEGNYLTADLAPSPLLHFWSLAVEEQFYLVWPLLLLLVAGYRRRYRAAVTGLVAVLWPVSLVLCVWLTTRNQPWAFYGLPTRAWELLTGAGLALLGGVLMRVPSLLLSAMGWAGVAGVVVAAVTFSDTTVFPGLAAALPVLATAAVVAAGPAVAHGPAAALRWGPLQWIGKRSYSIYLWHWPALVLVTAQLGPLAAWQRAGVVLASVGVAAVTFAFLEDPVRHSRWLAGKARRGLVLGGSLIGIGAVTALVAAAVTPSLVGSGAVAAPVLVVPTAAPPTTTPVVPSRPARATAGSTAPATSAPTGRASTSPVTPPATTLPAAAALAAANAGQLTASALTKEVPANLRPSLRGARADLPTIYNDGCHLDAAVTEPGACVFGDPAAITTVVLFGDSHAAQWFPAFEVVARQNQWRLLVLTKKGCPTADISVFSPIVNRELTECTPWRENVVARLAAERPALIVMSSYRYRQTGKWAGVDANEAWRQGLTTTLTTLRPLAPAVLVLGDTPTPRDDVPSCLSANLSNAAACVTARPEAVRDDRIQVEQQVAAAQAASFVSTSDWLCSPTECPVIVGDVLVYRDGNHITATAAAWLAPYVEASMAPLVSGAAGPSELTATGRAQQGA